MELDLEPTNPSDRALQKEFYVVRHGVCEPGDRLLGGYDAPLSVEGLRQARSLAKELRNRGIRRIVSSALQRAAQTAALIADSLTITVECEPRLNEISYGAWDGLRWEQIERADPVTAQRKLKDWWGVTPTNGEKFSAFHGRVAHAWRSLLEHPSRVTVVVGHRGVNAILLDLARRPASESRGEAPLDWKRIRSFTQDYGSYLYLRVPFEDLE